MGCFNGCMVRSNLVISLVPYLNIGNDPMKDPMSVWLETMDAPHGWERLVEDKKLVWQVIVTTKEQ